MGLIKQVRKKLDSYGIKIFHDYVSENEEHVFYAEHMILFVHEKENSIGVSFQVTTKPETVANYILIINEIDCDLYVMEAFIFNHKNEFVSGEKAHTLVKNADKMKVMQEINQQAYYKELLETSKCHEC